MTSPIGPSALRSQYESGALAKRDFIQGAYQTHRHLFEYPRYLEGTNVESVELRREGVIIGFREPAIRMWCPEGEQRHTTLTCLDFREYESAELRLLQRYARGRKCFLDIGANAGFYSIGMAKAFPDLAIHAFEPVPATHEQLRRNLALNEAARVQAHHLGLSDTAGELTFYFDATVSGASSSAPLGEGFETTTVTCPVATLDSFVASRGLQPDLIKCDVEGGELKTFLGARETLAKYKPVVFTEMLRKWAARFHYHPNDLIAYFAELGYICYRIDGEALQPMPRMTDDTVETNFFFIHQEQPANPQ
ncbi:hypothetical protein F183_A32450 [Bryobacterales bacterium F-183]|nr:hypothetical protein F183_A32450 [Bryobacterales bacterium F-183]